MDQKLERRRKGFVTFARKKGLRREEAEDFASDCVKKILGGERHTLTPTRYLWIDYMRHTSLRQHDPLPEFEERGVEQKPLVSLPRWVNDRERICLVLYCEFNFTMAEIAHVFGLTEARISEVFTEMKKRHALDVQGHPARR